MSNETPPPQLPVTWDEWHAQVRGWFLRSMDNLDPIIDDEQEHLRIRQVALQAASTANGAAVVLALLTGLGNAVVQLQGIVQEVIDKAQLDEAARADILKRVQNLEYVTVAEGQRERILEQLTGDLEDRLGNRLAGRLKGEADS